MLSQDLLRRPDVMNCDQEPIHVPGAVQPHGVLLALRPSDMRVTQCGGDTERLLGLGTDAIVGRKLDQIVPGGLAEAIERCLREHDIDRKPMHLAEHRMGGPGRLFDVFVHRIEGQLIVELENLSVAPDTGDIFAKLLATTSSLHAAETLDILLERVPVEVRRLTGFDRVMVYRFLPDDSGTVISEARLPEMAPYLGLRFPAFDIPPQARALYVKNWIRLIPDAGYTPQPMRGAATSPLNMSFSVLRSVSPVHLEYLKNMEVGASMSISIVKDGALWGLIACHHRTPRHVPHAVRAVCALLGQLIALEVGKRVAADREMRRTRDVRIRRALSETMEQHTDLASGLYANAQDLIDLVGAEGVAVCTDGKIRTSGRTPRPAQIRRLITWLAQRGDEAVFVTDKLSRCYPPAARWAHGAGVLAMRIAPGTDDHLLWFRDEILKTIRWAGDPRKAAAGLLDPGKPLSPRSSFAAYEEQVRETSAPWDQEEMSVADALRVSIVERSLRAALAHNQELAQHREVLIREINHRVKNSLQLTSSIINLQSRRVTDPASRELFAQAVQRIRVTARTHERLYRDHDGTSVEFGTYLRELCDDLARTYGDAKVVVDARRVQLPADTAINLALIANELVTNAFKYAFPDGRAGLVSVKFTGNEQKWCLHVADDGVGLPKGFAARNGQSLGMQIVEGLSSQLGATLTAENRAAGAVFAVRSTGT
ncbi:chemotaxis family two-component system sensor kinase Cph1 [Constrictibacter sp. MBR-5]|jgi:light-regulated signal transduction histidine kinase (bacteriophytochrome)|uniref:histidine kinase dimerization/phosphoacceptor domain -containing protein n=1 Tax=Constrictibacter sp. MBR-5 TaxID=3156467 RepID=UPI00339271D9